MCRVQYTCGKLEISVITIILGPAGAPKAVAIFVLHGEKTIFLVNQVLPRYYASMLFIWEWVGWLQTSSSGT